MPQTPTLKPDTLKRVTAAGLDPARLPRHVAIIMDGNGRWARQRGLPRIEGHRRGVESVRARWRNVAGWASASSLFSA